MESAILRFHHRISASSVLGCALRLVRKKHSTWRTPEFQGLHEALGCFSIESSRVQHFGLWIHSLRERTPTSIRLEQKLQYVQFHPFIHFSRELFGPLTWRSTTDGYVQDPFFERLEIILERFDLTSSSFQPFDTKSPEFLRGVLIVGCAGCFCIVLGFICWIIYMCIGRYADEQSEPLQGWRKRKASKLKCSEDDIEEDGLKKMVGVHL